MASLVLGFIAVWVSGALGALGALFVSGDDKVLGFFLLACAPGALVGGITMVVRARRHRRHY